MSATRLMASIPCRECGATLLVVSSKDRELVCSLCDTEAKVPKRVTDDLELGRKLGFDAPAELQKAIDTFVEATHVGPEAPGWALAGLALAAGGLGSWAYASGQLRPAAGDWALGAGLGLVMVMLPFGFTLQWLAATELGRKVDHATKLLARRKPECPRCQTPIAAPEAPGRFDCAECKTTLAIANGVVIVDEKPRASRWKEAVAGALNAERFLDRGGIRRPHRVLMGIVVVGCMAAAYFTLAAR